MSRRDPLVAVQHMRDNALRVLTATQGRSRSDLDDDEMLEAALIRWMEVIGEAARRVPNKFRARYPQVPWQDTTDLRNVLIHGYDTIDLDELWRITQEHLPPLMQQVQTIIDENLPPKQ
ncbi:MAG: DUF86 domain-containing protein [Chloroflexota bacterium]|nr:DUF86 domain-containing protein [Chloroflexota bacterium]MDE2685421.1 DUF86 domain-containing protein [Chloroflexota bacterium]